MSVPAVRVQGLVLFALAILLYSPALSAPLNPLDDRAIVEWLYNSQGTPLGELFRRTSDYYYRPVLLLTYRLDFALWGAETALMHLGNVLLHAVNVLLVFACAHQLAAALPPRAALLPFAAALLFAVHPVNSEAVNWIAARSDLLAGSFVLAAAWLLLHGLRRNRPLFALLALLVLVPGMLAKETALFFLPAALLIIHCGLRQPHDQPPVAVRWRSDLPYYVPFMVLPLIYLAVRSPALLSHDAGMGLLGNLAVTDVPDSLQTALAGIGFYARKLVWPWPLNFTIDRLPAAYLWLGLPVFAALVWAAWRRGPTAGLLLACTCLGMSAIAALLLRPAWTPVAERYLYIPSAFFCLALVSAVPWRGRERRDQLLAGAVVLAVLLILAISTLCRSLVWQDNLRLFTDAVAKSPEFPFARSVLADLLREAGREEEGVALIMSATAPAGMRNADYLDLRRAQLLLEKGDPLAARALIIDKRRKGGQLYYKFQELLLRVDAALLAGADGARRAELLPEYLALHRELHEVYGDPFYLYRLGQVYLQLGDRENAARAFRQSAAEAPPGAHYRQAAQALAAKLSGS